MIGRLVCDKRMIIYQKYHFINKKEIFNIEIIKGEGPKSQCLFGGMQKLCLLKLF